MIRIDLLPKEIKDEKCPRCDGYGILWFQNEPEQHHLERGRKLQSSQSHRRIMDALLRPGWTYPKDHTHPCGVCFGLGEIDETSAYIYESIAKGSRR